MKFRIKKKDFIIFVVYCVILLYLCAIIVLNFASLSADEGFYGLLPFKAFTGAYLPVTFLLFIIMLVMVFSTTKSYIFQKDDKLKGFGWTFQEKEEKGYARMAREEEIKNDKGMVKVKITDTEAKSGGVPLVNNGKFAWIDNGDYHNMVIGSTGSGKTECLVKPMVNFLGKNGESMIITDPKGELFEYSQSFLRERGYNIILLNFREPSKGNSWNPLTMSYKFYQEGNIDKATELLDDIAQNIITPASKGPSSGDSAFWDNSAAGYFTGIAMGLFQDGKEKEVNFNSIMYVSSVGEERYGSSHYINKYFEFKGEDSSAYNYVATTITAPDATKGGITSTFKTKMQMFTTREGLSDMLSYSDFDMRKIGTEKTAVFLLIHDEKKTYHSLMTIFIKQVYETLISVAKEQGGKLPVRTNFILDEFANMPALKDVDAMVSAARSRNIRFTFIIQNYAQLNQVYGPEVAQVIRGNCGNLIYLISTELAALKELSEMCGEVKSKDKDKTASTPLLTIADLQKLKLFEAIILRLRKSPFRTKLEPDFKIDWGIERKPATYPEREKQKIELFDLKKYVTEENNKRMMAEFENRKNNPDGDDTKMGGGQFPFNPYGGFAPRKPQNIQGNPYLNNSFNPMMGGMPKQVNPFDMNLSEMDIDAAIKDIDRKLKELDEQEKIEAEKEAKRVQAEKKIEEPKKDDTTKEIKDEPVIVDSDSLIVDEHLITDDEYFDDFFNDDDD